MYAIIVGDQYKWCLLHPLFLKATKISKIPAEPPFLFLILAEMREVDIRLKNPESIDDRKLNYVVMAARFRELWIFVRHRERSTWELVSGHIETGELPDHAALRELKEEAGVRDCSIHAICDYEVEVDGKTEYGRFYGARVNELNEVLEHEIEEITLADKLPDSLTYPEVHTALFPRALEHFGLS